MNNISNQLLEAKYNYNFFIMKMIVSILHICFKLAIVLLISGIFNHIIINIMAIIYVIMSLFSLINVTINYSNIISDIRQTLGIESLSFEIDVNVISNNLFKGLFGYGK